MADNRIASDFCMPISRPVLCRRQCANNYAKRRPFIRPFGRIQTAFPYPLSSRGANNRSDARRFQFFFFSPTAASCRWHRLSIGRFKFVSSGASLAKITTRFVRRHRVSGYSRRSFVSFRRVKFGVFNTKRIGTSCIHIPIFSQFFSTKGIQVIVNFMQETMHKNKFRITRKKIRFLHFFLARTKECRISNQIF